MRRPENIDLLVDLAEFEKAFIEFIGTEYDEFKIKRPSAFNACEVFYKGKVYRVDSLREIWYRMEMYLQDYSYACYMPVYYFCHQINDIHLEDDFQFMLREEVENYRGTEVFDIDHTFMFIEQLSHITEKEKYWTLLEQYDEYLYGIAVSLAHNFLGDDLIGSLLERILLDGEHFFAADVEDGYMVTQLKGDPTRTFIIYEYNDDYANPYHQIYLDDDQGVYQEYLHTNDLCAKLENFNKRMNSWLNSFVPKVATP